MSGDLRLQAIARRAPQQLRHQLDDHDRRRQREQRRECGEHVHHAVTGPEYCRSKMSDAGGGKEQDEEDEKLVDSATLLPAQVEENERRRDDEKRGGNYRIRDSVNQVKPRTQRLSVRRRVLRAREESEPTRHVSNLSQKNRSCPGRHWTIPPAAAHSVTVTTRLGGFGSPIYADSWP